MLVGSCLSVKTTPCFSLWHLGASGNSRPPNVSSGIPSETRSLHRPRNGSPATSRISRIPTFAEQCWRRSSCNGCHLTFSICCRALSPAAMTCGLNYWDNKTNRFPRRHSFTPSRYQEFHQASCHYEVFSCPRCGQRRAGHRWTPSKACHRDHLGLRHRHRHGYCRAHSHGLC